MGTVRGLGWALAVATATVVCLGQGVISTVAGNGVNAATGDGGVALNGSFHPDGLTVDSAGNIYIADQNHNRVRKVDTNGLITTVAGNGNTVFSGDGGLATSATVYIAGNHNGLAVDAAGNLYIADDGHHRIRKVDTKGVIATVAGTGTMGDSGDGGPATKAQLYRPSGVAVDAAGNLYIADTNNRRIRKVDASGNITTLAGNGLFGYTGDGGPAGSATMETPVDVAVDAIGNVYFADQDTATVRKVNLAGIITTVAGNGTTGFSGDGGPATAAAFASPYSVTVDNFGNLYISDYGNHRIRKVDASGTLTTIAGNGSNAPNNGDGGPPSSANVLPDGVAFDSVGNYYIADLGHNLIRKVTVGAKVPGLSVTASSLFFSYAGGNQPNAQIVTAFTTGTVSLGFKISSSTSTGGPWLNVPLQSGNTPTDITISINTPPSVGTYQGKVVLTPNAADLSVVTIPITLEVLAVPPARPLISANGVVNGASFAPGLVPNSLATILGTNLASVTDTWTTSLASGQLPTSLDGVTVLFNGKPGYLAYVSPTQINLIVPNISAGINPVVLTNHGISPTGLFTTSASLYAPAFFIWPAMQAVATRTDYSYAVKNGTFPGLTTTAAKPGDVLILWGTGFGTTSPAAPPGVPVPSDQIYSTSTAPTVTINNQSALVYGAALAPGFAGLYQVAIQVPTSLADGDWPVTVTIGGVQSPSGVVLSVQH